MAPTERRTLTQSVANLSTEVWRLAASRRLTIAVLTFALALALAGALAPMTLPPEARAEHARLETALSGGWPDGPTAGSRLAGVGLAALGALCFVRLLQTWLVGWGAAAPRDAVSRVHEMPGTVDEVWRACGAALSVAGLTLERSADRDGCRMGLARRGGLAGRLRGALYLGILLVLAAGVVGRMWGWSGEPIELVLGETGVLGPDGAPSARLEQLAVTPLRGGVTEALSSTLAITADGAPAERVIVRTGRAAHAAGLSYYELAHGPAVRVAAHGDKGVALRLQSMSRDPAPRSVARFSFSGAQQEQLLAVPDANLIVRLVYYPSLAARGYAGPVVHVRAERGVDGLRLAEEFLTASGALAVGDVTLDIGFEYYVMMRAAREPHVPVAAAGAVLVLAGIVGLALWPERRAWVAVCGRGDDGAGDALVCQIAVEPRDASAGWLLAADAVLSERVCDARDRLGG